MRRATLADLSDAEVAAAFNRVYEGYVLPFAVDAAWAREHLRINDIDATASPVWLAGDGAVAALAALGFRGERGWVGGFGIAPDHRRRGLGRALMDDLVGVARRRGVRRLGLEVLSNNHAAIALYERTGFSRVRTLRVLASPEGWRTPDGTRLDAVIAPADPLALLPHHGRFHSRPVAWQREPVGVARLPDIRGVAIGPASSPAAYLVYQVVGDQPIRLWDVAIPADPGGRDGVAALLAAVAGAHPSRSLRLLNEPAESPIAAALDGLGWDEPARQEEMARDLA